MKPSETDMQQGLVQEAIRNLIEAFVIGAAPVISAPAVGAPTVVAPAVGTPVIGCSSSTTKIRAVVVRVCSQLEEHRKMLHNHGKMLKRILMSIVGDSTLPLGDTPLLRQYQFSTLEKTTKHKREGGNEKEDGKRKKWKMGDEKDNNDKKDIEDNVKSKEEKPQVAEEEDSEPSTLVVYNGKKDAQYANEYVYLQASTDQTTISVKKQTLEVEKTKDEASQASANKTTTVSVEEQTIEVTQTEVVISHQEDDVGEASQVIDVHIKALIHYFDTQYRARPDKERIVLVDVFVCKKIYIYDSMVDVKIVNARKKNKLSPGHQLIEDQISTILPKILIWRDFANRSSPPTGSEVKDCGLNSKWTTRFGKYPIQPNGYDCGVYMLVFLANLLRGIKFPDLIDGNEYRFIIAYDILRLEVEPKEI
ncbi:hypothetical protein GIB67_035793 [Kingdonia uniflora]|uniref:Ubiquitin-like protease family profile domain-containing protein n=1 Tax=Kingdonia uniflora TaxID=39325 RepID=A0A7J7MJJ3_9MAGN|nr:hypothetical protein GIB67_035793 [Kingdonia uniflora]